jgi:hypothetical protein
VVGGHLTLNCTTYETRTWNFNGRNPNNAGIFISVSFSNGKLESKYQDGLN